MDDREGNGTLRVAFAAPYGPHHRNAGAERVVSEQTFRNEEARHLYEECRAFMDSGEFENAIEFFQKSNRLSPHFKTLELQGECLHRLGRLNEAVVVLAASTALNRGVRAPSLLAKVFLELGETERSIYFASDALSKDPNNKLAQSIIEASS